MATVLTVTARFLQPYFHGRGEDGRPEWPPSPLRLFQALVAGAFIRSAGDEAGRRRVVAALEWLERLAPPDIVAPMARAAASHRTYVPDNDADREGKRSEKEIRPMVLEGSDTVYFVFGEALGAEAHMAVIRSAAMSMTHLGWGVDQVVGDATLSETVPAGELWTARLGGGVQLRCTKAGTLTALEGKHQAFLGRLDGELLRPVPPLTVFDVRTYARATDAPTRPVLAYRLLNPETGKPLWLDPPRRARDVAAWLRHAADDVSQGWPFGSNRTVIHGHTDAAGAARADELGNRLSYLAVPSITPVGVQGIARGLIVGTPGLGEQMRWIGDRLAGLEVSWLGVPRVIFEPLDPGDGVLSYYLSESASWSTVTPVVLPGHHDNSPRKAESLLRKAFVQAGVAREAVDSMGLEWRDVAFRPGAAPARSHLAPDKVSGPQVHVRVTFARAMRGPLAVGSGRHRGLGLFARA